MKKTLLSLIALGAGIISSGCIPETPSSQKQASIQVGEDGLLPEYSIRQIKRNLAGTRRGIQDVFTYCRDKFSTSGETEGLNEKGIKRNFNGKEGVNVVVAWRYGCTKNLTLEGRYSYSTNTLDMDIELYDAKGSLIDSKKGIKNSVPKKDAIFTVGRDAFLLDYNRLYSHELSILEPGFYVVKCKLVDNENNLSFSRETSFKVVGKESQDKSR